MSKRAISIFFLGVFALSLITPAILSAVGRDADVLVHFNIGEEEKGNEKDKEIEVFLSDANADESSSEASQLTNDLAYYLRRYTKPYLNQVSPPPEHHIL